MSASKLKINSIPASEAPRSNGKIEVLPHLFFIFGLKVEITRHKTIAWNNLRGPTLSSKQNSSGAVVPGELLIKRASPSRDRLFQKNCGSRELCSRQTQKKSSPSTRGPERRTFGELVIQLLLVRSTFGLASEAPRRTKIVQSCCFKWARNLAHNCLKEPRVATKDPEVKQPKVREVPVLERTFAHPPLKLSHRAP